MTIPGSLTVTNETLQDENSTMDGRLLLHPSEGDSPQLVIHSLS